MPAVGRPDNLIDGARGSERTFDASKIAQEHVKRVHIPPNGVLVSGLSSVHWGCLQVNEVGINITDTELLKMLRLRKVFVKKGQEPLQRDQMARAVHQSPLGKTEAEVVLHNGTKEGRNRSKIEQVIAGVIGV